MFIIIQYGGVLSSALKLVRKNTQANETLLKGSEKKMQGGSTICSSEEGKERRISQQEFIIIT